MGNLVEELKEMKIKTQFDRYLRTKLATLSDLIAEEQTEKCLLLLDRCYKDGYEDGYGDAMLELSH